MRFHGSEALGKREKEKAAKCGVPRIRAGVGEIPQSSPGVWYVRVSHLCSFSLPEMGFWLKPDFQSARYHLCDSAESASWFRRIIGSNATSTRPRCRLAGVSDDFSEMLVRYRAFPLKEQNPYSGRARAAPRCVSSRRIGEFLPFPQTEGTSPASLDCAPSDKTEAWALTSCSQRAESPKRSCQNEAEVVFLRYLHLGGDDD